MSRTDSHKPGWVQVRDPGFPWRIAEYHYHHGCFGATLECCDVDFWLPRTRRAGFKPCEISVCYSDYDKVAGRSRWRRSWGSFQDHRARMDLRRLKAQWLKESDREEIDSTENMPTSRWCWRGWYWD